MAKKDDVSRMSKNELEREVRAWRRLRKELDGNPDRGEAEVTIRVTVPLVAEDALQEYVRKHRELESVGDLVRQLLNQYAAENSIKADFTLSGEDED